jgi:hypothetical protein
MATASHSGPASTVSATLAELSLPLARPVQPALRGRSTGGGTVIQRCSSGGSAPGKEMTATTLPGEGKPAGTTTETIAKGLDIDDVVERVMRRLTQSLNIEIERHGGRRWI